MDFNKKKTDSDNLLSTIDENNYRQLIEYLSPFNLGIVLVDIKTKIPVVFNSAAHQILGYSGAEFKTKNIENHEAADDIALTNHLSESVDSGVVKQFETTLVSKSGEPRNFRMSLQKVKFGDHQYYLLMYEDITDEYSTTRLNQAERQVFTICNSVSSKTDFIRDLLSFFKSFSGCEAVGIRLRNGDDFPYFETTGFSKEFVEMEISLCAYDEGGNLLRESGGDPVLECMCGNVIRGRYDATKPFLQHTAVFGREIQPNYWPPQPK
jgi:PAS domain S-box-containing protein